MWRPGKEAKCLVFSVVRMRWYKRAVALMRLSSTPTPSHDASSRQIAVHAYIGVLYLLMGQIIPFGLKIGYNRCQN